MAPSISTLYDDFALPSLDRSKWDYANSLTNATFIKGSGMRIMSPSTGLRYGIRSRALYNLTGYSVSIQLDSTPTGAESDTSFSLDRGPGSNLSALTWWVYSESGVKKIKARVYNSAGDVSNPSGGAYDVAYSPTQHKYMRFSSSASEAFMRFQTSVDGVTWVTRTTHSTASFSILSVGVKILVGDGLGGYAQIRRVTTALDINRGKGFLEESWSSYPQMTIPLSAATPRSQFGQWYVETGTQAIIQSPDTTLAGNNVLKMTAGTGATAITRAYKGSTALQSTIRDVDFSAQMFILSESTSPSMRMTWRDNTTPSPPPSISFWYLKITRTAITPGYYSGGTDHDLTPVTVALDLGKFYTFRVVHVGSELVVFVDGGSGTTYGSGPYGAGGYGGFVYGSPVEIGRWANVNVSQFGTVGFRATSSVIYVQRTSVSPGIVPPTQIGNAPVDPTQIKPWTGDRTAAASRFDYLYLEDDLGSILNIVPSYGDVVLKESNLGSPTARTVIKDRPLGNGVRSYTRFHGEKPVALVLSCLKTAYHPANYYADLVQRWAAPGKKSRLVYKPVGGGERYINIEGSQMGSVAATAVTNQLISLDVAFIGLDGGDYEVLERSLGLTPDTSAYAINSGSLATECVIRLYGPSVNPIIYHESIEANEPGRFARLGLTIELAADEFVELDTKERSVQFMGLPDEASNRRSTLTTRDWFWLTTLRNSLRYTSEDLSGTAVVTWHDKY